MTTLIELPPIPAPINELWHVLMDLQERLTAAWSLIGGQMVFLHALEHGHVPPQISQDGDVIADIRADPQAITALVKQLEEMGFALDEPSVDGLAHRYKRDAEPRPVVIDVLAPDGLGERASLLTSPPGRTVEVPGGTQALGRTEVVTVVQRAGGEGCLVPHCSRPSSPRLQQRAYRTPNATTVTWLCFSASSKTLSRSSTNSHGRTVSVSGWPESCLMTHIGPGHSPRPRSGTTARSPTGS